ncbi:hypothetical protein Tsubulata_018933 [Turnera subulata]|uniref:MLO-like protein n=1 Tax=Turnera subulata TaxID=218843 RepID=A0A9Q0FWK3_9ROSI|nr:hypothetical protein Tsubulata_018933 [Turnera subulata]
MLPCKAVKVDKNKGKDNGGDKGDDRRKLLMYAGDAIWHRVLAASAGGEDYCTGKNKVSLISQSGVHQLHIFIFVLAVIHVIYSVITVALAQAKVKKWKSWEMETTSLEYQFTNDPSRFRFARQTSFVKRHTGLSETPGLRWIVAFFRQFFASVTRVDYLTLRHGFINAHFAPNSKFNFHKYIKRSMEDDFKKVVGISIPLWICSVIFQLLNVYGWYTFTWIPFIPLVIVLVIGAKLQIIIMEMAQQIQDKTTVVKGVPMVEPSNKYFWFNRPDMILFLIHFTLFQNAFQMAHFLWTWYEFGLTSCFHENLPGLITRVVVAIALQLLCSYVTFPLYALVTQMGSHMKKAIFEEQTAKALMKWQKAAKERKKLRSKAGNADASSTSYSYMASPDNNTPSRGTSPIHLLHKFKHNSTDLESGANSPKGYYSETELQEIEGAPPFIAKMNEPIKQDSKPKRLAQSHSGADFSFAMP